ncbi:MAG TPA: thiol reductant ABC exporter subunit CydC [Ktedonobacteraceae bacterium]|jgi:ATP-binding cassette subfamily C protein CydC
MATAMAVLGRLWHEVSPLLKWMVLALLLGVLTIGCGIGLLTFSGYLISQAALHPSLAALAVAMLGVRVFGVLRGVFRYLERLVTHDVTFRLLARFRAWFYHALEPLAPARLITHSAVGSTNYTSGDLLSRFVADVETLQDVYARAISPPVVAMVIGVMMWLVLGAYQVLFALTFLSFFLLAGIGIPVLIYLMSRKMEQRIVQVRALLHITLVDSIQGMADLLAFDQVDSQQERVWQLNRQLISLQASQAGINGLREMLDIIFTNGCVWTMLLVAIPFVRGGQLNGIYLAVIALAALSSFEAVRPLANVAQQFGGCMEAARRLFHVVDVQPAVHDPEIAVPFPSRYDIEVRNLSFHYPEHTSDVLRDINFSVPQGRCLAIVGPSGAGKSTLASLLLRFWEYEQGSISLGRCALNTLPVQDIHHCISVVEQQTHLFNATVRENLLLARPGASEEEIQQAARQALLHDFIQSLPLGYDTLIGEQGFKLSGGERQRLAIARALLKDAPILLLDEPTAHLDASTEEGIIQTLRTFMQGRTTLIITHRLVGLDVADEILVMQDGRIRERGVHDDLLQAEGLYWKLWMLQNQMLMIES